MTDKTLKNIKLYGVLRVSTALGPEMHLARMLHTRLCVYFALSLRQFFVTDYNEKKKPV